LLTLELERLSGFAVNPNADTPADRAARKNLAMETARLWDEFRKLFLGDEPGAAT
jgi:hypothetical protein